MTLRLSFIVENKSALAGEPVCVLAAADRNNPGQRAGPQRFQAVRGGISGIHQQHVSDRPISSCAEVVCTAVSAPAPHPHPPPTVGLAALTSHPALYFKPSDTATPAPPSLPPGPTPPPPHSPSGPHFSVCGPAPEPGLCWPRVWHTRTHARTLTQQLLPACAQAEALKS